MVNIDLLEIGKTYTYKELCELFNEPRMSHHSRDSQKKRWACYFKWINPTTQKYLISEIYETPQPLEDGRKGNGGNCTSKYLAMDDVIMDYIIRNQSVIGAITGTIVKILTVIGLVSQKYRDNRQKQQDYGIRKTRLSSGVVNHVFWQMDSVVNSAKSALERLEQSGHLFIMKTWVLVTPGPSVDYIRLGPFGTARVNEIRKEVYKQVKSERKETFSRESQQIINDRMCDRLTKFWGDPIDYVYMEYTLIFTEKEYTRKTNQTIEDLTRKFAWKIFKKIYKVDFGDFYKQDSTMEQVIVLTSELLPHMTPENWERLLQESEVKEFGNGIFTAAYQLEHPPIEVEYWGEDGKYDDAELEDIPWD